MQLGERVQRRRSTGARGGGGIGISLVEVLLQLLVGVVDAKLLEVVLDEDLESEDIQHADELIRVLSLF